MIVAVDTETNLIKPGMLAPKLVCGSFAGNPYIGEYLLDARDTIEELPAYLSSEHTLVGHNIAYDLAVCAAEEPALLPLIFRAHEEGRIKDTIVRQKLIDIANGEREYRWAKDAFGTGKRVKSYYTLQELAKIHLGRHLEKLDTYRMRYHELDGIPIDQWPAEAREYALEDAKVTLEVYQAQERVAEGEIPNETEQTKAAWVLHLMSAWGVRTDPAAVEKLLTELETIVREGKAKLTASGIYRADGTRDMKAIREKVVAAWPAGSPPTTDGGAISTSAETLRATSDPDLHALAKMLEAADMLSDWGDTLRAGTKAPICARYDVLKETGRTGCSQPNMQNPPTKGRVRECFVPRPGFVYAQADYSTLELCAWAQVCIDLLGYSTMADALRAGQDLHTAMGAQILGVSYEVALARVKAGDKEAKHARQLGKQLNFGLPGGMGAERFAALVAKYGMTVSVEEATRLREKWFAQWREAREYFNYVSRQLNAHADAQIVQVRSGRVRGDVTFCSAANGYFQGLAADGAKEALWNVARECYLENTSPLFGSRLAMFLHDEIICEVPEARAHDAAHRLSQVMVNSMRKWIPHVPIAADPVLMRRWYKGAEALYVDGRLVPSRPEKVGEKTGWVQDV